MQAPADHRTATSKFTFELPRPLRAGIFTVLGGFMLLGPFCYQALDMRHPAFRPWTMFTKIGIDLADLKFSVRQADGSLTPIEYFRVLGYPDLQSAPFIVRSVTGLPAVRDIATKLCAELGPGTDLRAHVRIAKRSGWRTVIEEADGNLCQWQEPR